MPLSSLETVYIHAALAVVQCYVEFWNHEPVARTYNLLLQYK